MQVSDFYYELDRELIAQYPQPERSASRLLVCPAAGALQDRVFHELVTLLRPSDLLVFNDTRVIPARLYGRKESGGGIEILIERALGEHRALAQVRGGKRLRPGMRLHLEQGVEVRVTARVGELFELEFVDSHRLTDLLQSTGHIPLPPYIDREDQPLDRERYQTVYARRPGAVAAPTAGLHFDAALLRQLADAGIASAFITLHVGAGTFAPVRVNDLHQHRLHPEYVEVDAAVCAHIEDTRRRGGRVIAVGTTTARALESAVQDGALKPFCGDTALFIRPGFRFRCVDALITNFHLPGSTLLMLVCAFAGHAAVMAAYRHVVRERYRFYSYGDAMFVSRLMEGAP